MYKVLSTLLAGGLVIAQLGMPVPARAQEYVLSEEYGKGVELDLGGWHAQSLPEGVSLLDSPEAKATITDAKFDPRDGSAGYTLPAVRHQLNYGTCWAHSMVFDMELSLIKAGYADAATINLSELQTAYYANHYGKTWSDPDGGLAGDGYWYNGSANFLTKGVNQSVAANIWGDWKGLVQETATNGFLYNTTNGNALYRASTSKTGGDYRQGAAYADNAAHLMQYRLVPTAERGVIKNIILEYGTMSITYMAEHKDSTVWNATTKALYIPQSYQDSHTANQYNHAVNIIGWDDTYSRDNFATKPEGDGAWIVRGSWGANWGDKGYFYLSYYDASLYKDGYVASAVPVSMDYQHNYQYDGARKYDYAYSDKMANVFTVQGDYEAVEGAYFETYGSGYTYEVAVYTDFTDENDPESGRVIASASGVTDYPGSYRIAFENAPVLTKGTRFAVVVDLDSPTGKNVWALIDANSDDSVHSVENKINPGETYVKYNGVWKDATSADQSSGYYGYGYWYGNGGNAHIKAYTNDVVLTANITEISIGIAQNNSEGIVAQINATTDIPAQLEYRWSATNQGTGESWLLKDWTADDAVLGWNPDASGTYILTGEARVVGTTEMKTASETVNYAKAENDIYIKGKCQMPYAMIAPGEEGYLIGVETNQNPNQSLRYELMILDCTLLAEGKDAWTWSSGQIQVPSGNAFWQVWQPQYGYYWTLFRVYDAEGNLICEDCYGFANIC